MRSSEWPAYNALAWIDMVLSTPEDTAEECERYYQLIRDSAERSPETLLHLGCGAGLHDYNFKQYFSITGVDISEGMLKIAQDLNPGISYILDDMRSVRLDARFDAVIIPDSIGYMTTEEDLRKAIETAGSHLKPGGVLLITAHLREEFQENNFVYTGSNDDVSVTVFENNTITGPLKEKYEAVIVYLIRRNGELTIHHDRHVIGLFSGQTWNMLFEGAGLKVQRIPMNGLYDRYIMGEGEYPLTVFICRKSIQ